MRTLTLATCAGFALELVGGDAVPALFALLLAYGVCFPRRIIILLIPPIPLPAWLAVILYAGVELVMGVSGTEAKVAHFAHLGGMLGAWLVLWRWRRSR